MGLKIKPREKATIIQALRAGVVPKIGLHHIQVGRKDEVASLLKDIETIGEGGAIIRFIIGRFGSGKTFFLNLTRILALEKKLVVAQADITTEHRLSSTTGHTRALYSELMKNLATRANPQGGALASIIERWISSVDHEVRSKGGKDTDVEKEIYKRIHPLQELVGGYDFAYVLTQYLKGYQQQNEYLQENTIRWLRGEYTTKTEARKDIGVRNIIGDTQFYDYLKLMGRFVTLAGYKGMLVNLDEMGVLSHRLTHTKARNSNYEAILRILNDCLQGNVSHLGFLFSGIYEFLEDPRRGLYSFEALKTRLAANTFATEGIKDLSGPVIRLNNLTPEDLYVLLMNIRHVFASGDPQKYLVSDEALGAFMQYCAKVLGDAYFKTPRDTVKKFVDLLSVLEQNPEIEWHDLLAASQSDSDVRSKKKSQIENPDDELVTFRLK